MTYLWYRMINNKFTSTWQHGDSSWLLYLDENSHLQRQ